MCSDYDGDDSGRYHDRTYKLGDAMSWWLITDRRYPDWRQSNAKNDQGGDAFNECCYSTCSNCEGDLYVIIRFQECVPVEVLEIGLENKWPERYFK